MDTPLLADGGINQCAVVTILSVFFTPQACAAFVAAEQAGSILSSSGTLVPTIDEPSDGDALTPDDWSIFAWHVSTRDSRRDPIQRALDLLEPSAYAAPPLEGQAFVLEFTQGCSEVLRVYLETSFWGPDPASWSTLTSVSGPVQVRLFAMHFTDDQLDGPPVASAPITISMQSDE